jgi:hypothetical protein
LPRGQGHERKKCRLNHCERSWLERDVLTVYRDILGECADTQVTWSGIDLIADLELRVGSGLGHDASDVMAEHEWPLVPQEQLELAIPQQLR